jgi:hypothetical protein
MKMNLYPGTFLLMTLLLLLASSCTKEISNDTSEDSFTSKNELLTKAHKSSASGSAVMLNTDLLKSVRTATARYHSSTQSIMNGYQPNNHCVSAPGLGGMGYHWVNPSLVDPVFDPLKPEVLLYATGAGGKLQLVAIEYIVINVGQPRPMFGDQPFDIGGTPTPVPHWSLHVWMYEENPNGMFVNFNPNISCP